MARILVLVASASVALAAAEETSAKCTSPTDGPGKGQRAFIQTHSIYDVGGDSKGTGEFEDDSFLCSSRCAAFETAQANASLSTPSCETFCLGDCPCLKDWSERCELKSCSKCEECFTTTTTTKPPILGFCTSSGDPHIKPFDSKKRDVDILGPMGDYWIVQSNAVHIQARYGVNQHNGRWASNAHNKLLGISGSFIDHKRLVIGTSSDSITLNGETIMDSEPGLYNEPNGLFKATQAKTTRTKKKKQIETLELTVELPLGMVVKVNRYIGNVDYIIQMFQAAGGQDGHCGNFNEDATDDTENAIKARMMFNPTDSENIFESKLEVPADYSYAEQTVDDCEEPTRSKALEICKAYITEEDNEVVLNECVFDLCFLANSESEMQTLAAGFGVMEDQTAEVADAIKPFRCNYCCGCIEMSGGKCVDGGGVLRNPELCYKFEKEKNCGPEWPRNTCKWTPPSEATTRLLNKGVNKCITPYGWSMQVCAQWLDHRFRMIPETSRPGVLTIKSNGGECLTKLVDGYDIWQSCRADNPNQKWELRDKDDDGFFSIQSLGTNLCLDAPASECPSTHPWAYRPNRNMDFCCSTADDKHGNVGIHSNPDYGSRGASCKGDDNTRCRSPPCVDYQSPYVQLGGGYCTDWKYLPEGAYPDHLPSSSPQFSSDRIMECMKRCQEARKSNKQYSGNAFYVKLPSNLCACAKGKCSSRTASPDYVSYAIVQKSRIESCSGGDSQRWKFDPFRG